MSDTMVMTRTDCDCLDQTLTSAAAFTALRFHFGMLLGVDDFETERDYHAGKMRLHNAWLHRAGVVWGFHVHAEPAHNEIQVEPGLALDATGHELHLDRMACVDVGGWYAKHEKDSDLTARDGTAGRKIFDGHVVAIFRTCLARQVPALADDCEGGGSDTAYSRTIETIELRLLPGLVGDTVWDAPAPYRRLRLLFDVVSARPGNTDDADVVSRRDALAAIAEADRPAALLALFRELAARDVIELAPADAPQGEPVSILPALEGTPLVLADVANITLAPAADGSWIFESADVRETVRRSHIATAAIQELLCSPALAGTGGAAIVDAGGPRVTSVVWDKANTVTVTTDRSLAGQSVAPGAFAVAEFHDVAGWMDRTVATTTLTTPTTVEIALDATPTGELLRFVARGTGLHPLLGIDHVPLAGATGGPPGTAAEGHDYVNTLS
jgi:hypothetical protein